MDNDSGNNDSANGQDKDGQSVNHDASTYQCATCHKTGVPFSKRQANRAMMGGEAKCKECVMAQREEMMAQANNSNDDDDDDDIVEVVATQGSGDGEATADEMEEDEDEAKATNDDDEEDSETKLLSKEERKRLRRERKKNSKESSRKKKKKDKKKKETGTSSGSSTNSDDEDEPKVAAKFSDDEDDDDDEPQAQFSDDENVAKAVFSDDDEEEENSKAADDKDKENQKNSSALQIPRKRKVPSATMTATSSLIANVEPAKPKPKTPILLEGDEDDDDDEEVDEFDEDDPYHNSANVSVKALTRRIMGRKVRSHQDDDDDDDDDEEDGKPAAKQYTTTHEISPELRKELSCVICHETFLHPVSLLCGHSFCQECIQWWWQSKNTNNDNNAANNSTKNCPTCRQIVPKITNLGVNTALRACVMALLGDELQARLQAQRDARRKATRGENEGAHDAGYEVLVSAQEDGWKQSRNIPWPCRRSIVLDAEDQRMQLALGIWRDSTKSGMYFNQREQSLQVSLCLLNMEEDEAADGGFPRVVDEDNDEDNEQLLASRNGGRFVHSFVRAMAKEQSGKMVPLGRRGILSSGVVDMSLDLSEVDFSSSGIAVVTFQHEESGATLDLKVSGTSSSSARPTKKPPGRSASTALELNDDDDDEEDGHAKAYDSEDDGSHLDRFEDDGFIANDGEDDEEEEEEMHEDDLCAVCKSDGDLIVCDGGDNMEGCARSFHIGCIKHDIVPPGDWICQDCAQVAGINVGIEGYEFPEILDKSCVDCEGDGAHIICDGGDHVEGCGAAFHLDCIKRTAMPRGDWICHQCAHELSLDVGSEGYVFPIVGEPSGKGETIELSDDNDDDDDDDDGDAHPLDMESPPQVNKKRKRLAKTEGTIEIDNNSNASEEEEEEAFPPAKAAKHIGDDTEDEESDNDELEVLPPVAAKKPAKRTCVVDSDDDE